MKTRLLVLTLFVGALLFVLRLQAHDDGPGVQGFRPHGPLQGVSIDDPDLLAKLEAIKRQNQEEVQVMIEKTHAESYVYKGTKIEARGHDDIAQDFNKRDLVPPERLTYFGWCMAAPKYPHTGWYGYIKSVTQTNNDALVEIFIGPHFRTSTITGDHYIETWRYKNKQFTFVSGVGKNAGRYLLGG